MYVIKEKEEERRKKKRDRPYWSTLRLNLPITQTQKLKNKVKR